jgi:ribosome-binding protein aMBF1 (putative translation factor)
MKQSKRDRLAARGWTVGSVQDFLNLSDADAAVVELRLALSRNLKACRTKRGWSQVQLAKRLKSSQSRIAKMEAGDASVSVDLLFRSLFVVGAKPRDLARTIGQLERRVAV